MLSDLPPEIIYHIATLLPTASALAHLALTCRRLHQIISSDGRIFRSFVQSRFPSIETPPFWKDATQALTSRSRALDRRAVVARFVVPSSDAKPVGIHQPTRHDRPTIGYRPSIDSYEVWTGGRWIDRKEVLVWGAGAEIISRITRTGHNAGEQWLRFNDLEHVTSLDDIRVIRLLRTGHPRKDADKEHLIYGRVRGDVVHVAMSTDDASYEHKQTFITNQSEVQTLDLSSGPRHILAIHTLDGSISLYHTATEAPEVTPFAVLRTQQEEMFPAHISKFLSPTRIAYNVSHLMNSIVISDITDDQISTLREFTFELSLHTSLSSQNKIRVNAIAPLNVDTHGNGISGEVFLAGWGSTVRLHDLRSPSAYEREFIDTMDDSPAYCIQPLGDRFVVGAGAEAIVKVFDIRMKNAYDYADAKPTSSSRRTRQSTLVEARAQSDGSMRAYHDTSRGNLSCFLSQHPPGATVRGRVRNSYRGPIYAMSSPSPSSSTIYAGVVDGIVRLDFASTDDLLGRNSQWYRDHIALDDTRSSARYREEKILDLSGYERPTSENKIESAKLRSQSSLWNLTEADEERERDTEWDRRWKRLDQNPSWRSGRR